MAESADLGEALENFITMKRRVVTTMLAMMLNLPLPAD
jgi:hypothetical protein